MPRRQKPKKQFCKRTKKRRFPDKNAALDSLHTFQSQVSLDKPNAREVTPQRVYYCKSCNGYHLTSQK